MPNFREHAYFRELAKEYPEIFRPRDELCFERSIDRGAIASKWYESGAVLLRDVIRRDVLSEARATFHKFIATTIKPGAKGRAAVEKNSGCDDGPAAEWNEGEVIYGSWHAPWVIRHNGQAAMAMVVADLIGSWAWPVIEEICRSTDIVVMFGLCIGRHNIDQDLSVGVHQDAVAVNPDVPLSIWIPLHEVVPRRQSGLGFIVPSPGAAIPAKPNNDIGVSYVIDNVEKIWVPHYRAGDLSIHSRYSPHFTTGYGTLTDRYSLEVRLWAHDDSLRHLRDPSVMVSRRDGALVISETRCSKGIGAHHFVATLAHLAMVHTESGDEIESPGLLARLGRAARRTMAGRS